VTTFEQQTVSSRVGVAQQKVPPRRETFKTRLGAALVILGSKGRAHFARFSSIFVHSGD